MSKQTQSVRPRWAVELADDTWERINELLYDGWDNLDIVRELKLPKSKLRSLQVYAQKFGPRRRLQRFAEFKDAMMNRLPAMGPEIMEGLQLIAAKMVSENVKDSTQLRAGELMTTFVEKISGLAREDAKIESQRAEQTKDKHETDPKQLVSEILSKLGIAESATVGGNGGS